MTTIATISKPDSKSGSKLETKQETARVIFQPIGRQGEVPKGMTLLEAARRLGVELESICGGNQTCGKCKVMVEEGDFAKFDVQSAADHLTSATEREQDYAVRFKFPEGMRLSCACQIQDDLVIRVPEESQMRKQIVRKAIGIEREVRVDASMRLYYVELPSPHMKDHRGDWERLQDELQNVHRLENLSIDLTALRQLQPALSAGKRTITATVWHQLATEQQPENLKVVQVRAGFHDALYGIAVDVGTTTVAGHLCHLRTGEVLATASRMNPQVPYGEDLMSRVSYAMMNDDGTERMHEAIIDGLNGVINDACAQAEIFSEDIVELVLVGNTTMHHLILGVNPRELGGAPFSLVTHNGLDVKARDLGIRVAKGANIHLPACEAGHVGADNVGVLTAEAPYHQDEQKLIIDIGTNGELLLGNRAEILSASSPTGPAFEGAQIMHGMRAADGAIERIRIDPTTLDVTYKIIGLYEWQESQMDAPDQEEPDNLSAAQKRRQRREQLLNPKLLASGICGSGIIEAIAELFKAGMISPKGRFLEINHPRLRTGLGEGGGKAEFVLCWPHETSTGQEIVVHSDDIRAIQLAKAALYAGAKLLMNRMSLGEVDRVILAGGFGSYIDPLHAMILGLIPDCNLDKVQAVGNAAGDGARMILLDKEKRREAQWAARWVTYIETAVEPSFQDEFVGAIEIPHASDPFPHLQTVLGDARTKWSVDREAAFAAETSIQSGEGIKQRGSREDRAARRAKRKQRRGE